MLKVFLAMFWALAVLSTLYLFGVLTVKLESGVLSTQIEEVVVNGKKHYRK